MSLHGEAGSEVKTQAGVVLKPELKTTGTGVSEEFDEFNDPPPGLGEVRRFLVEDHGVP